jgi:hypothetical protein
MTQIAVRSIREVVHRLSFFPFQCCANRAVGTTDRDNLIGGTSVHLLGRSRVAELRRPMG